MSGYHQDLQVLTHPVPTRRFSYLKGQATNADVIAFCGVRFMAETAKILSPEKIVVLPDMDAGCSLEDSCPPDKFKAFRDAHPDHIALSYINCSAEVKALRDRKSTRLNSSH